MKVGYARVLVLSIKGALAEFERALVIARTQVGLQAAKKRGVHLSRPPNLTPERVARTLGVGESTLYRHLQRCQLVEAR